MSSGCCGITNRGKLYKVTLQPVSGDPVYCFVIGRKTIKHGLAPVGARSGLVDSALCLIGCEGSRNRTVFYKYRCFIELLGAGL